MDIKKRTITFGEMADRKKRGLPVFPTSEEWEELEAKAPQATPVEEPPKEEAPKKKLDLKGHVANVFQALDKDLTTEQKIGAANYVLSIAKQLIEKELKLDKKADDKKPTPNDDIELGDI